MSLSSFLIYNASIKVLAGQTFVVGTESTFGHILTIISISIARSAVTSNITTISRNQFSNDIFKAGDIRFNAIPVVLT